jgi:hypothetical protein
MARSTNADAAPCIRAVFIAACVAVLATEAIALAGLAPAPHHFLTVDSNAYHPFFSYAMGGIFAIHALARPAPGEIARASIVGFLLLAVHGVLFGIDSEHPHRFVGLALYYQGLGSAASLGAKAWRQRCHEEGRNAKLLLMAGGTMPLFVIASRPLLALSSTVNPDTLDHPGLQLRSFAGIRPERRGSAIHPRSGGGSGNRPCRLRLVAACGCTGRRHAAAASRPGARHPAGIHGHCIDRIPDLFPVSGGGADFCVWRTVSRPSARHTRRPRCHAGGATQRHAVPAFCVGLCLVARRPRCRAPRQTGIWGIPVAYRGGDPRPWRTLSDRPRGGLAAGAGRARAVRPGDESPSPPGHSCRRHHARCVAVLADMGRIPVRHRGTRALAANGY